MDLLPDTATNTTTHLNTPQKLVRRRYKKTVSHTETNLLSEDSPTRGYDGFSSDQDEDLPDAPDYIDNDGALEFTTPGKHNRDSTASLEAARKKARTEPAEEENAEDCSGTAVGTGSLGRSARRLVKPRKSRFIEGSMRDRASEKPLKEIIGDYNKMEEKENGGGHLVNGTNGKSNGPNAGGEKNVGDGKEFTVGGLVSSVFTFRAINYCKDTWWNPRKAKFEEMERKRKEKEEQKRRAEEKYFDMKKRGTLFTTTGTPTTATTATSVGSHDRMEIDEIGKAVSTDEIVPAEVFSPPPDATTFSTRLQSESSHTPYSSDGEYLPPKSTGTRRLSKLPGKDAAATLKKRASRLFSPKTNSSSTPTPAASAAIRASLTSPSTPTLSKREQQKQQRLIKKYSDLEDKLAKARRELEEAGLEPPVPVIPQDVANRYSLTKTVSANSPRKDRASTGSAVVGTGSVRSSRHLNENDKPEPLVNGKRISAPIPIDFQSSQVSLQHTTTNTMPPPPAVTPASPSQTGSTRGRNNSATGSVRSRKGSLRGRHVRSISMGSSRGSPPPPVREGGTPEVPVLDPEAEKRLTGNSIAV